MLPHYLAKFRSSNIGISGRKWKWKCTMPWILNTRPILMHLAYLLTYLFQFPVPVKYFLNSRRCYLKKCCELKQRFLHVWHGIDQTIIDNAIDEWRGRIRACMRAKGGHFEQLFWQYSATWQETFQFLSNVTRFLNCFFFEITTNSNFNLSQGTAATYWRYDGKYYMHFVGNLLLFQQWRNFENPLRIDKIIAMSLVYYFFGTQCIIYVHLMKTVASNTLTLELPAVRGMWQLVS